MATSLASKDRIAHMREEALASMTRKKARVSEGLEKVTTEITKMKKALLEAKSEVEVLEL